ncbi:MAG: T9SS type A sorting domain-containing protein [Saprospiraceae bacterium]
MVFIQTTPQCHYLSYIGKNLAYVLFLIVLVQSKIQAQVQNINTGNNYATIQSAIDDVATLNGHTISVSSGNYSENIIVSKSVTILGPNANINPCNGIRVAEARIYSANSSVSTAEIFHVAASNVTIQGFTIDGDNTSLTSGFLGTNGADLDAAEGVTVYESGISNLKVSNNVFQNLSYFGVTLYDYPAAVPSSGHLIENNKFINLGTYDLNSGVAYWGGGILLYNNQYASVIHNCMENVRIGIQTGNFHLANPGAVSFQNISDNSIEARRRGIFHNLFYNTASPYNIENNTIVGIDHPDELVWDGILIASQTINSTIKNNHIDGSAITGKPTEGIEVWNVNILSPAIINGGSIKGVATGIYVNNFDGYSSDAPDGAYCEIDGISINGILTGIRVTDSPLSSHAGVFAHIKNDCEIEGNPSSITGIIISGTNASALIMDNDASIHGFQIGIDVDGAYADINNNHIYNNGIGIRFSNLGFGNVVGNNFNDAIDNGTDLLIAVTGGMVNASSNNWFAGDNFGVNNLSQNIINAESNFWDHNSGPSSVAAGSGVMVSSKVLYCPWLNGPPPFGVEENAVANFTFSENGGPVQLANIINNGLVEPAEEIFIDICNGGKYQWNNITSNATHVQIVQVSSNGNIAGLSQSPPPTEIEQFDGTLAALNAAYFNGSTQSLNLINPINTGVATQMVRFYNDVDVNGDFDPAIDCYGDPIIINYIVSPAPILQSTINGLQLTANNDGLDESGSLVICNAQTNNLFFTQFIDVNNTIPSNLLKVEQSFVKNNVLFGPVNSIVTLSSFSPAFSVNASLVNQLLPGTLSMRFRLIFDVNDNNVFDSGDCAGDWLEYNVNIIKPRLQASLNGVIVNSNNDGIDDFANLTLCNGTTNNLAFDFFNDLNNSGVPLKAFQEIVGAINVSYPFCSNCSAPLTSFSGATGTIGLINPLLPGTLTLRFKVFYDANNNNLIDTDECPGDWVVYSINLENPVPVCPPIQNVSCVVDLLNPDPALVGFVNNCSGNVVHLRDVVTNQTCRDRYTLTRRYGIQISGIVVDSCSQTILVNDLTAPSVICPSSVSISCAADIPPVDPGLIISADHCGNLGIVNSHLGDVITNQICTNKFIITRTYQATDICGNARTCTQTITVNDNVAPTALCNDLTVYLNSLGTVQISSNQLDNGSFDNCNLTGIKSLISNDTIFNCDDIGILNVTLTVTDVCENQSVCNSQITVLDTTPTRIFCSNQSINLSPGECDATLSYLPLVTNSFCNSNPYLNTIDSNTYKIGGPIKVGIHQVCYIVTDRAGNSATCCAQITVNEFPNASRELACNGNIQISLDDSCEVTINADMVLEGGQYGCYDKYIIEVRPWNGGALIDRNPNKPGVQIDYRDIGKELKISIIDPRTGNSCWGKAFVEDKLAPKIICPADAVILCSVEPIPLNTGTPLVIEKCGSFSLTYKDDIILGSCEDGYQSIIHRTWTAVDESGNKSICVQNLTISLGDLTQVKDPHNYDDHDQPTLSCNERRDTLKNVIPHLVGSPQCVDGYLLDSIFWNANSAQPDIYPLRRIPRILGWNWIQNTADPNYGHPSPDHIYYPTHTEWDVQNPVCWGPDQHIMWHGTGRPLVEGCENLALSYQDIFFDLSTPGCKTGSAGCYKIVRQWTILDWCSGQVKEINQIIKVIDKVGPEIVYPDSITVNMSPWLCYGEWMVAKPWIADNCSDEVHFSVEVEFGTIIGDEVSGYLAMDLPPGIQYGYIVAYDCCGNVSRRKVVLNILDETPPQAVCQTRTVVSIVSSHGFDPIGKAYASSFDDGSFDNCNPHVFFKVIRMSELLGTRNGSQSSNLISCGGLNGDDDTRVSGNQIYFDDEIKFCCEDIGKRIQVVFRVFDVDPGTGPVLPGLMNQGGFLDKHFSDCMVEVDVQDKVIPSIIPPPDVVVSCAFWFDVNNISNINDSLFGRVVSNYIDRREVKTNDVVCAQYCEPNTLTGYQGFISGNPLPKPVSNQACEFYQQLFNPAHKNNKYNLTWGFDGYIWGGCGATPRLTVQDLRHCGQGKILRIFSITGPNNIVVSATQTIWVVNCDPFYVDLKHCNDTLFSDIIWPNGVCNNSSVRINDCKADLSPDNPLLGRPQVVNHSNDHCSLIAINYSDDVFTTEVDACYKVLRKWVVIDWCQYDPHLNPGKGRWEQTQVIEVMDQTKPEVKCFAGPCEPADIKSQSGICSGHIQLTAEASDLCTKEDWLSWEYKIDLFNDNRGVLGNHDYRVGALTRKQFLLGDTVQFNFNPSADYHGNPFDASGIYPLGIHRIIWFVEDGCGNIGICEKLFEIKDCKAPTPQCLSGIITVPMPTSQCIDIWARDLDKGSYDNCTKQENLKLYFNGDPNKTSIRVCCDDFVKAEANDELVIEVEVWVEDEEGNKDFCKTLIIIQDNQNICPNKGPIKGTITGNIRTSSGVETKPVDVMLYQNGSMMRQMSGSPYSFGDLKLNQSYQVSPDRNDEPLNGVTTNDIVKIQKHILGLAEITDPYKLLAADVNASKGITASDMAELRKLILGINSEFKQVRSWTFVPSEYKFQDPKSPWDAPRSSNLLLDRNKIADFVSIKMGDITGDSKANGAQNIFTRSSGKLNFVVNDLDLVSGENYKIGFKSSDFKNIVGYQFTLKFDQGSLRYEGVESGALQITESNFGSTRIADGILTTSWNADEGVTMSENDELFILKFKAIKSGKLSNLMVITGNPTLAQAYDDKDNILEAVLTANTGKESVESGVFELLQNEPNPFSKETSIGFRLPETSVVKLTIYDATGKVISVQEIKGQKGLNQHKLSIGELNTSGVLYYQLDTPVHTATKKMVILN